MADLTERVHELKVWPEFFEELLAERKTFEIRNDDRGYRVGDTLWLREWVPDRVACDGGGYTGRECRRVITYTTTWEQKPNYVVLALRSVRQEPVAWRYRMRNGTEWRATTDAYAAEAFKSAPELWEIEPLTLAAPPSASVEASIDQQVERARKEMDAWPAGMKETVRLEGSASVEQARREALEEQAVKLWKLLDDIDTLDDACRSNDALFRERTRAKQRQRFEIMSGEQFDALAQGGEP